MENTCCVCIEPFTKQPHKKQAKCPYCDVKACVKCTQTYLLGISEDAHCMGCRKAWTREVMDSILLSTWLNNDYKKHRENVLLDREKSRLPAAQIILERKKSAHPYIIAAHAIETEIEELRKTLHEKQLEANRQRRIAELYNAGQDPFSSDAKLQERRIFVMPCPATDCRGFLSQSYKCGVCDIYACPECREIKGANRDSEHTCDPNTVASVQALKKNTRPCPECGTHIFKIDGCNQMFCTSCKTPFDWTSGKKIVRGAIHNPHYFEYIRAANGGIMPRAPGDIPCGANLPSAYLWERDVNRFYKYTIPLNLQKIDIRLLYNGLMTATHFQQVEIRQYTNNAEDLDNTDINLRYLQKEITDDRWKQLLQQREKRRIMRDEVRLRLEAYVGACVDIYGRFYQYMLSVKNTKADDTKVNSINKILEETLINQVMLRTIFNEGMMEISRRYKCQVIQVNKTLDREKGKYTSSA